MGAISRAAIEGLTDRYPKRKKKKRDANLTAAFLQLFEEGQPLQEEQVLEWRDDITPTPADHIKECLKEALSEGWVEEHEDGLLITAAGVEKAKEAVPPMPDVG